MFAFQRPIPDPPYIPAWYEPFELGSVTDVISIVVGIVGIALAAAALIFAWRVALRQFKMMEEQGRIIDKQVLLMEEQTRAAKQLEVLTAEQGVLMKRQAEIAETQHGIIQNQLAQKADLRIRATSQHREGFDANSPTEITFVVKNGGDKTAEGCYWEILMSRDDGISGVFVDEDDSPFLVHFMPVSETEYYDKVEGHHEGRIFPGDSVRVALFHAEVQRVLMQNFSLKWRIKHEGGIVPKKGFGTIHFKMEADRTYAVKNDDNLAP